MARKRYTPEQIIRKLRDAEVLIAEGMTAAEAARKIGVSEQTYYRWRKEYGGMQVEQAKRLKTLEQENVRLKRLGAEKELDIQILKEALELLSPAKRRRTITHICEEVCVSERRACMVVGVSRSSHRYQAREPDEEPPLIQRMTELALKYGRCGYRRITVHCAPTQ
jgi:transposase-like protein